MAINFPSGMLFVDPRSNSKIPNAQLSFFVSGTAILGSVYQDAALTTLWTQPISADVNGNFPPNIYFDPFQSIKAKIQLADSLGATKWTVDPYFVPLAITPDSLNLQYANNIFEVRVPSPPIATPCLTVSNLPGSVAVRVVGGGLVLGGSVEPAWEINNTTTGVQTASLTLVANKPGPASSTPTKWLPVLSGGVTYFIPCFI